ncbi:MAG: hypothetical protein M0Z31_00010 [Clostridia bacterium]|nr:hypothetical protein [Clostridia bacterium]
MDKEAVISAQVNLISHTGKKPAGYTAITSENFEDYLPSKEVVDQARNIFETAGFMVGPVGGLGFSISGPVKLFESFFNIGIIVDEKSGVQFTGDDGANSYELPTGKIPGQLGGLVTAVTFSPPPAFGPTDY